MNYKFRFGLTSIVLICTGMLPSLSRADLAVTYSAVEAELVFFNQPQKAPFSDVALRIFVKGSKIRMEIVDHMGRRSLQLVDRSLGTAYELDPENRTYRQLAGRWSCENIAQQIGRWGAYGLRLAGTDTLVMESPVDTIIGDHKVVQCVFHIQGRFLGAPRPVYARLVFSMPVDEASVFGESGLGDLYCGSKPSADDWNSAYSAYWPLGARESAELAVVTGLPLQVEINTDLGLGRARLVVRAIDIQQAELDDSLFLIPDSFTLTE